jgi:hypothetical protein
VDAPGQRRRTHRAGRRAHRPGQRGRRARRTTGRPGAAPRASPALCTRPYRTPVNKRVKNHVNKRCENRCENGCEQGCERLVSASAREQCTRLAPHTSRSGACPAPVRAASPKSATFTSALRVSSLRSHGSGTSRQTQDPACRLHGAQACIMLARLCGVRAEQAARTGSRA